MWRFVKIRLENIASHRDSEYFFKQGCTPIFGENRDKPDTSNGAGKSSLYDAISIALLGEPVKAIANKDIVRNGLESGLIYLSLENPAFKKSMEIEWQLHVTKSWSCKVTINGDVNNQLVDVNGCKEKILAELGISKSDLINYFIVSRGNYTSFFKARPAELEALLNRFSKADKIDATIELTKTNLAEKQVQVDQVKVKVEMHDRELAMLNQRLDDVKNPKKLLEAREELIYAKKLIIESYRSDLEAIGLDVKNYKELIELKNNKLNELTDHGVEIIKSLNDAKEACDFEKITLDDYSAEAIKKMELRKVKLEGLEEKLDQSKLTLESKNSEITEIQEIIANIESSLRTAITCPACQHVFSLKDKDFDAKEAEQNRAEGLDVVEELRAEKEKLSELLELAKVEVREERQRIRSDEQLLQIELQEKGKLYLDLKSKSEDIDRGLKLNRKLQKEVEEEISRAQVNLDQVAKRQLALTDKIDNLNKELSDIVSQPILPDSTLVMEIQDEINECQMNIDLLSQKLRDLQEQLMLVDRQGSIFTQFKRHLASQCVAYLNREVNAYLEAVGEPTRLKLESQRMLSTKKLKDEFNVKVLRGSSEPESIHKFSNGEMAILEIFVILTVQKFINQASKSGGLDFLGLDEICDGIDATNFKHVLKVLYSLNQTVMIVSHLPLNVHHDKCIVMVKENGITKLIEK